MTGPLANEFASVRDALRLYSRHPITENAVASLARIEEHTHDMENALNRIAWGWDNEPRDIARAALSAGEGTPR